MSLTDTFDNPQSRVEAILQNAMGAEHEVVPQSRVEELLERLDGYLENIEGRITDQDEEIIAAVNAWLEEHPEATTTVPDNSLSEVKFTEALKLKTIKDYVTPEMFGAVGDGVTDDTNAWQSAVDFGVNVIATNKKYKCGQINVTNNIEIDCNGADFICTENVLFNCHGTVVETIENESDYAANQQYSITNSDYSSYSGFAMLKGTNNFEEARSYYLGGFVCEFSNGQLCNTYPVDVVNTEIDIINPITIKLCNIGTIAHIIPDDNTKGISINYGLNCVVKNIKNYDSSGYIAVEFKQCLNCVAENLNIKHSYGVYGTNSYIVAWFDSSFCTLKNSNLFNQYWHCVTTGANYLCYHNLVDNCTLKGETMNSYEDHDNARNTIIKNSVVSNIGITSMGVIENVSVTSLKSTNNPCLITIIPSSDEQSAVYTLKNIRFLPDNGDGNLNSSYVGIYFAKFPQIANKIVYVKEVNITNVKELKGRGGSIRFQNSTAYTCHIDVANIDDTNLEIWAGNAPSYSNFDITNYRLNISNIRTKKDDGTNHYPQLAPNGLYTFNDVSISNCDLLRIQGIINNLSLSNVKTYYNANCTINGTLSGAKLHEYDIRLLLKNVTKCIISDAYDNATGYSYFNICIENNSINCQRWANGALTTEQITVT